MRAPDGPSGDSYVSPAMQWGTDKEAEALSLYEFQTDEPVEAVGFVDHPAIADVWRKPGRAGRRDLGWSRSSARSRPRIWIRCSVDRSPAATTPKSNGSLPAPAVPGAIS